MIRFWRCVKQQKVSVCALACACVLSLSVGAYADIIDSSSAVPRFAETASTFSGVTPATGTWAGTNDVAYVESDTIFFDIDSVESTVSFTPTSAALEDAKMEVCVVSGVTCSSVCTDDDLAGFLRILYLPPDVLGSQSTSTGRVDSQHNGFYVFVLIGFFELFDKTLGIDTPAVVSFSIVDFAYRINYSNLVRSL